MTTLAFPEIIAGKTKALFDRPAVRDLYDVHRIQSDGLPASIAAGDADLYRLQRRVRIYYASLSKSFPCPIDASVVQKFTSRQADVESELYPVLNVNDRPTLDEMIESAGRYIDEHVAPRDEEEIEYVRVLDESSEYVPSLLFAAWPAVLARAEASPCRRVEGPEPAQTPCAGRRGASPSAAWGAPPRLFPDPQLRVHPTPAARPALLPVRPTPRALARRTLGATRTRPKVL